MAAEVHHRTCHLCEAICGLVITLEEGRVTDLRGDPDDPLSRGHICPKATAIADLQEDPDRLRRPMKRVGRDFVEISWEEAIAEAGDRLAAIARRDGGSAVAVYRGNPNAHNLGLVTHGPVISRALKTRSNFSATTVDQIPHHLTSLWMYGHAFLVPIADIDRTNMILMLGANPCASNGSMWTVPGVRGRLDALVKRGGKLVVVDPRRTETAKIATEHLPIAPGNDAAFLVGLLNALKDEDLIRPGRLMPMLTGFDAALGALARFSVAEMAAVSGIPEATIRRLARDLGTAGPALVYGRLGVSVQPFGTLCQWLIQLLNIAIGSLDREGGMMLTAPAVDLVQIGPPGSYGRWRSRVGGLPESLAELPVAALADEILTPGEGQVRGLIVVGGNPVLSTPNGRKLDRALESLEAMVAVDMYVTETSRHAHIILPPSGPLEKDHYPTFFFSFAVRNVARYSAPVLPRTEGSRDDWEILVALAERIAPQTGGKGPQPGTPADALDVMLEASGRGISLADLKAAPSGIDMGPLKPQLPERLKTADQKIHCAPEPVMADIERFAAWTRHDPEADGLPLRLIGRRHMRSNNSWLHNSPRLIKGPERCTLMIHPADAARRGLGTGDRARVRSRAGEVELVVEVTDDIMAGVVSIPHGFGHDREGVGWHLAAANAGASVNDLTDETRIDPVSGNAAVNGVPVEVARAVALAAE